MDKNPSSRRRFLQTGAVATGAVVLCKALPVAAQEATVAGAQDLVLKLDEHTALETVGGFEVIPTADDKVIVVRTGEDTFSACSAICTHRQCTVTYNPTDKVLACPCHGSRFALDGKVLKGPAKMDLKPYAAQEAVAIKISTK
jgi:cytochrome b6-f complex iron-sulfur subunit